MLATFSCKAGLLTVVVLFPDNIFCPENIMSCIHSQCDHLACLIQDVAPAGADVVLHVRVVVLSKRAAGRTRNGNTGMVA
jgi:hypothetical protein